MSTLPWIPRFDFPDYSLTLTYPVTSWNPGARTEGRVLKSGTGIPGPSLRVRKYTLGFTLRYLETEWPSIIEFITRAQSGAPFVWFPQGHDDEQPTFVDVLLESPRIGDGVRPARDSVIQRLFTLPIVIARTSAPWDLQYFRVPSES